MSRNLSTGIEASATGESLNRGDVAVHPAARHNIDISSYYLVRVLLEEFRRRNLDLNLALASTRTRERVQAVAAAKGGWPVCDSVLRLAGAAYGGSKETFTTVGGDEGRCVVSNLRKVGCSMIADFCDGDGTISNVTPVVLREDTRPPAYGDKYSEGASRTFYTRYTCLLYTSPSPRD